jgi:ribonuclease HI
MARKWHGRRERRRSHLTATAPAQPDGEPRPRRGTPGLVVGRGSRKMGVKGASRHKHNEWSYGVAGSLELLRAFGRSEPAIIQMTVRTSWCLNAWRRRGMRTSRNAPVENRDLIEAIGQELDGRQVRFEKVPGHAGHRLNELANAKGQRRTRVIVVCEMKA